MYHRLLTRLTLSVCLAVTALAGCRKETPTADVTIDKQPVAGQSDAPQPEAAEDDPDAVAALNDAGFVLV